MSEEAPAATAPQPDVDWVTWAGAAVWTVVSVVLAVAEVFLLPLATGGGTHVPVAVVVAVIGNLLLPRVFVRSLGLRFGWAVPALAWFGVILAAATRTADGDLVISGSDYATRASGIFLVVGALAMGVGAATARMSLADLRRRVRPAADAGRDPAAASAERRPSARPGRK